jgi:hypothetical protein
VKKYVILKNQRYEYNDYSLLTIQPEFIQSIRIWRNQQISFLRQKSIITELEQIYYFNESVWPDMNSQKPRNILMGYFKNKLLIGYGGFVHISWEDKRAEISVLLSPDRMLESFIFEEDLSSFLYLIQKIAFEELELNRLFTETYSIRATQIAILEKCGFKYEGKLKQHVIVDSVPADSIIQGVISADYYGHSL